MLFLFCSIMTKEGYDGLISRLVFLYQYIIIIYILGSVALRYASGEQMDINFSNNQSTSMNPLIPLIPDMNWINITVMEDRNISRSFDGCIDDNQDVLARCHYGTKLSQQAL